MENLENWQILCVKRSCQPMVLSSKRLSEGRVQQKYISHLTFVTFYFFDCFPFKQCDTLKTIRRGFHVWKEFNWRKSTFWMSSFTFLNFTKQFVDLLTVRIFSGKQEDFIIFAEGENTNLTFFDFRWVRIDILSIFWNEILSLKNALSSKKILQPNRWKRKKHRHFIGRNDPKVVIYSQR